MITFTIQETRLRDLQNLTAQRMENQNSQKHHGKNQGGKMETLQEQEE